MKFVNFFLIGIFFIMNSAFAESIVMTLSDYSTGNTAVFDIETGAFTDNTLPHFQDAQAKTDGEYLYILEGFGADAVSKYDTSAIAGGKAIYQYSTGAGSNPREIVFTDSKAYILLYSSDKIWVVNPDASEEESFKLGEIDISQWADGDGSPEAQIGFVYEGMVYVVLQIYDVAALTYGTALLIKIDSSTDTIVDMDEKTEGIQGVELSIKNPQSGSLVGSTLYLAGTTYGASDEGVLKLDITNPSESQEKLFSEADAGGSISGADVFIADYGLVYIVDENWNTVARVFNSGNGTLGETLPVPNAGGGAFMVGDGAVMVNGLLYVISRDFENPGMYIISPFTDEDPPMLEYYATELPPYSIVHVEGTGAPDDVAESGDIPEAFILEAPYPNPFNPSTTVSFSLAERNNVRIDVFNVSGQKVDTLVNSFLRAGYHSVVWNAASMSSGIYYIWVSDGIFAQSVKVTLIK